MLLPPSRRVQERGLGIYFGRRCPHDAMWGAANDETHAYDRASTTYQGLLNWSWGF